MPAADPTARDVGLVIADGRRVPRALRGVEVIAAKAAPSRRRVVVLGPEALLAAVLTALLRAERLDVEVAPVRRWRAGRALRGRVDTVPLVRDETATVLVGEARWVGRDGALRGEAIVDDTVLFDGTADAVVVRPTGTPPGLRAAVAGRGRPRWVAGRAAQLGTTGALVVRDGVEAARPVRRSTFYRHVEDWRRVR